MIVLHPDRLGAAVPHETLVITGSPRGGTSIVAYILLRAGYFLGRDMSALNHEDREIAGAFTEDNRLLTIIEARNREHQRWGFKFPKASMKLEWLASNLRNPVFVIVYRNPLAIARSIINRQPNFDRTEIHLKRALERGLDRMTTATASSFRSQIPAIFIDIDDAIKRPAPFLSEFLSRLSVEVPVEFVAKLAQEVAVPGYKKVGESELGPHRTPASKDGTDASDNSLA
jgi:hypothetical protein